MPLANSLDQQDHRVPGPRNHDDARGKILLALALIVAVGLTPAGWMSVAPGWPISLVHLVAAAALAAAFALANVSRWYIVRRLAGFAVLLSPWVVFMGFAAGSKAGWATAVSTLVKALLTVGTMLLLVSTTSHERLLAALGRMGVPRLFIAALEGAHRYGYVLAEERRAMSRARQSRTFDGCGLGRLARCRTNASLAGMLLVRAAGRAERVHAAMLARTFDEIR